jgi:hypothetical protein
MEGSNLVINNVIQPSTMVFDYEEKRGLKDT